MNSHMILKGRKNQAKNVRHLKLTRKNDDGFNATKGEY